MDNDALENLDNLTCLCGPGELCKDCAPEGLQTLVQLQLSLPWARETAIMRQLVRPEDYLRQTCQAN